MRVISRKRLRNFWEHHQDAMIPLQTWFGVAKKARWLNLTDVRQTYPSADIVGRYTIFNIKGGRYRIVVRLEYKKQLAFIKFVGTHAEYDRGAWK